MRSCRALLPHLASALVWFGCARAPAEVESTTQAALSGFNVLTRNYDGRRAGANLAETALTTGNVNTGQFGKLFAVPVDDQVYAGVLYASGVSIAGGVHNVLYVATVNNSVYAYDADAPAPPLWQRNFNGAGRPTRNSEVGQACGTYRDFSGNIGIVGTPVIDGAAMTMYFVTRTVEGSATVQRLRAVDITTGNERAGSPHTIAASSGGVSFDPVLNNQRTALALAGGRVSMGWSSFCDTGGYHGWVMSYDATSLAQTGTFPTTPTGSQGGIWMAGAAPALDSAGNLYLSTGNGSWNGTSDFGESVLKLGPGSLPRLSFFTPSNFSSLNDGDLDLGSAGLIFVPGTNLLVTGGKGGGTGYLLDGASLGGMVNGDAQIPQKFQAVDLTVRPTATHHIHNSMVSWQSPAGVNVYVWGENDFLRAYRLNGSQRLNTPAFAVGSVLPPVGMPGGMMTVSANGSAAGSGILWATVPRAGDANQAVVPGALYAFNAETLALLWSSAGTSDDPLNFSKGNPPVVASGKVYVTSLSNQIFAYGSRTSPPTQNLALNKPATGSTPCNSNESPAKAVNGSVSGGNTDKFCSLAATRFLQVDLGTAMSIAQIVVEHAGAGGEDFSLNTRAFTLQTSTDGTSFTTAASATTNIQSITTHDFAPRSARFVRLNITTATQGSDTAARIYELQVFAPLGTVSPTLVNETESLAVAATSGDVHRVALDSGYSGGQGTILEGDAAGDFVSYTVSVPEARTYDVRVRLKRLGNRGIWQLAVSGANVGPTVDGFATAASFPEVDLGNTTFTSTGNKTFRFTVTGKNPSSTSFWIALDYIKLVPQ